MNKSVQSLLSFSIVAFSSILLLLFAACSTSGMDFTVSDQALNKNNSVTTSSSSEGESTNQEEENKPQVIIPKDTTQQDDTEAQIIPEAKESKANTELNCEIVSAPDISYWPNRSPRGELQNLVMFQRGRH